MFLRTNKKSLSMYHHGQAQKPGITTRIATSILYTERKEMSTERSYKDMKLYDYAAEFAELFDSLDNMAGNDDLEQAWFDTLESIEAEFEDKVENVAAYIKQLKGEADMLREQEQAFTERRRAKEHHVERLKKYLLDSMAAVNLKKIDRPLAVISVRSNAESPCFDSESGFIEWARENADELLRYKDPEIDKTAVKRYLQEGHELDGVRLERSQSVIIK